MMKFKMGEAMSNMYAVSTAVIVLIVSNCLSVAASVTSNEKLPVPQPWGSSSATDDLDLNEEDYRFFHTLIAGIITVVIVVLAVCLILCFCCPICVIAKMRQRRGVVLRPAAPASNGQTITVNLNRSGPPCTSMGSPPVVAIPNNLNARNKPYPVQESVTVVPLLQPQQPVQYPSHPQPISVNYPTGSPYPPQNFELPPPYPGLARESDTANLPYNPYFSGDGNATAGLPPK